MWKIYSQHFLTVIFQKGTIFERLKGRPGGNGKKLEIELEIAEILDSESSGDIELSLETDFTLNGIIIYLFI